MQLVRALIVVAACGGTAAVPEDAGAPDAAPARLPDQVCPGDPECVGDDGALLAGVGLRDVTPEIPEPWVDVDANNEFDSRIDSWDDRDDDGLFDAVWLVNSNGRAAIGKREGEEIWVRCLALARGDTTVALCAGDFYGYFYDQVRRLRDELDPGLGVDLVLVGASHTHSAPDTLGQSGPNIATSGIDPAYDRFVREQTALAIADAVRGLRPVNVTFGVTETVDETGSVRPYVSDTRDPVIFDPRLTALRFADAESDATIATLVQWAAHPEFSRWFHPYISADYPAYLRKAVEDELGGTCVYFNGALGGQVGPGDVQVTDPESGEILLDACPRDAVTGVQDCTPGFRMARIEGENVAGFALRALAEGARTEADVALSFRRKEVFVHVDNDAFQAAGLLGLFDREQFGYDETRPIDVGNIPSVISEVAVVRLGPAEMVAVPGEMHPELWLGCYQTDAAGFSPCSYDWPVVTPTNKNPPDLATAPEPPYLRDLLEEGVEYGMVLGLTPDQLGYLIPAWNYQLADSAPFFNEAPGEHYEETNSLGPRVEREIIDPLRRLMCWRPEGEATTPACETILARIGAEDAADANAGSE